MVSSPSGVDPRVRPLLVCPSCRGQLDEGPGVLICPAEGLAYPVRDGVSILLPEKADKVPKRPG